MHQCILLLASLRLCGTCCSSEPHISDQTAGKDSKGVWSFELQPHQRALGGGGGGRFDRPRWSLPTGPRTKVHAANRPNRTSGFETTTHGNGASCPCPARNGGCRCKRRRTRVRSTCQWCLGLWVDVPFVPRRQLAASLSDIPYSHCCGRSHRRQRTDAHARIFDPWNQEECRDGIGCV